MVKIHKAGALIAFLTVLAASPGWTLSLEDVTTRLDNIRDVQAALLELEAAKKQYSLSSYPGDPDFSLSPSVSVKSEEGGTFGEQLSLQTSVNAGFPLGLSADRTLAMNTTKDALGRAQHNLEHVRADAYVKVFLLYQKAWLAQREEQVLQAEVKAAKENLRITRELFESGQASLLAMNTAEDELNNAETALISGSLAKRITWLELAYTADLTPSKEEILEPVETELPEIPKPPELAAYALDRSPEAERYRDSITEIRGEISSLAGVFLPPTVRLTFSGWEQSASLSYNAENPNLGLSYTFPAIDYGTDFEDVNRGSGSIDTWELGISVSLPLRSGSSNTLEEELLRTQIAQNETELEMLANTLALQIRSRYQQYVISSEAVEQATRSIDLARSTFETVMSRREEQRATLADELSARAQLDRAEYRYEAAAAENRETKLLTAQISYRLGDFINN